MSATLVDARRRGWYWVDNTLIDEHGAALGPYGLTVYHALARHADGTGQCFPSLARVATLTGMGVASVRKAMTSLVARGLIRQEPTRDAAGDPGPYCYTLLDREGVVRHTNHLVRQAKEGGSPHEPGVVRHTHPKKTQRNKTQGTREKRARATTFPEDHTLTDPMAAYARDQGCQNPPLCFGHYRDHWMSKGGQFVDWGAAWRTWCRRHRQYGGPCQGQAARGRGAAVEHVEHRPPPPVTGGLERRPIADEERGRVQRRLHAFITALEQRRTPDGSRENPVGATSESGREPPAPDGARAAARALAE